MLLAIRAVQIGAFLSRLGEKFSGRAEMDLPSGGRSAEADHVPSLSILAQTRNRAAHHLVIHSFVLDLEVAAGTLGFGNTFPRCDVVRPLIVHAFYDVFWLRDLGSIES